MLGNPLVRFREGWGGNLVGEYPIYSTWLEAVESKRRDAGWRDRQFPGEPDLVIRCL